MEEAFRAEFWRKIWKLWGLRAMVLFALAFQIVLNLFGHKRKSSHNLRLKVAVWFAYLTADSVATVALGVLSNKLGEVNENNGGRLGDNDKLLAFWSPLLLILLGGPDTITSYSLEDNALWLRHCLGLAVQTSGTAYIIFMAWTSSYLSYLSLFIAVVGLVKYAERVCSLWMASNEKLKQSVLEMPDLNLNYLRILREYTLNLAEGYDVMVDEVIEVQVPEGIYRSGDNPSEMTDSEVIVKAHGLFQMFKCLFVEWTLSHDERNTSKSIFTMIGWERAFTIVEIELGFLYDLLHTKAMVLYTKWGLLLRSFTFSSTLLVLVLFSLIKKSHLSRADLSITYLLLAVIVFFETYSILKLVSSDWSEVWLHRHNKSSRLRRAVTKIRLSRPPRWSRSIAQFSLLSFCSKERPLICHNVLEFLKINEKLEKYHYTFHVDANEIQNLIFDHVQKELLEMENHGTSVPMDIHESLAKLLTVYKLQEGTWATEGEFDQVVLTWHIATELLYHSDPQEEKRDLPRDLPRASMLLSRYMFYLLVRYPSMLPNGIREIRLHHTTTEAFKFFEDQPITKSESNREHCLGIKNPDINGEKKTDSNPKLQEASKMLLGMSTMIPPSKVTGGRGESVLYNGCWIGELLGKPINENEPAKKKWELISTLWMKILMYAASKCRGDRHAGQLRRGGELLTHVWLLMAHFGLTDHFQKNKGQVIAKLILR